MQYSKVIIASAAFAVAQAVVFDNTVYNNVTAGRPYTLTWSEASGAVTLLLKDGDPNNLNTVSTIATGLAGTSYTWDVPSTQTMDTYAFEIVDTSGETNYSPLFQLIGGVASTSSASASASSTSGSSSTGSSSTASSTGSSTTTGSSSASTTTSTSSGSTSTGSKTTSTGSTSTGTQTTSATPASSTTSAPGSAAGLESPLALVLLALAAIFTLN